MKYYWRSLYCSADVKAQLGGVKDHWLERNAISIGKGALGTLTREESASSFIASIHILDQSLVVIDFSFSNANFQFYCKVLNVTWFAATTKQLLPFQRATSSCIGIGSRH